MNPLKFKKAKLITEDECTDGLIIFYKEEISRIPKKTFVPLNEMVFYTDSWHEIDQSIIKCRENGTLDFMAERGFIPPFIDTHLFEKNSGLVINFTQPSQRYQGGSVYVNVFDILDFFHNIDMTKEEKTEIIKLLIQTDPPKTIKNKILSCSFL